MGDLVDGFLGSPIDADLSVVSAFMMIKAVAPDGSITWSTRAGGARISTEELVGVLTGLAVSVKQDIASEWS